MHAAFTTMTSLSSIVIDEDAIATHHPALEEGVRPARRCIARLKIVDMLPWVPPSQDSSHQSSTNSRPIGRR